MIKHNVHIAQTHLEMNVCLVQENILHKKCFFIVTKIQIPCKNNEACNEPQRLLFEIEKSSLKISSSTAEMALPKQVEKLGIQLHSHQVLFFRQNTSGFLERCLKPSGFFMCFGKDGVFSCKIKL